jgi:hypothetical protein
VRTYLKELIDEMAKCVEVKFAQCAQIAQETKQTVDVLVFGELSQTIRVEHGQYSLGKTLIQKKFRVQTV